MGWEQPKPLAFVANQSRHDRSQAALLMLGEQAELLPGFSAEAQGFHVVGSVCFFRCVRCHGHYDNVCVSHSQEKNAGAFSDGSGRLSNRPCVPPWLAHDEQKWAKASRTRGLSSLRHDTPAMEERRRHLIALPHLQRSKEPHPRDLEELALLIPDS